MVIGLSFLISYWSIIQWSLFNREYRIKAEVKKKENGDKTVCCCFNRVSEYEKADEDEEVNEKSQLITTLPEHTFVDYTLADDKLTDNLLADDEK